MRFLVLLILALGAGLARGADFVVAVSVDGMGSSYMQALIDAGQLPHFRQLQEEGAFTTNARTDYDVTVTLPNHVSMATSRRIRGPGGHNWTSNTDPAAGMTIHSNRGAYVASVFDVAHDSGKRTGLWATKTKFALFNVSYDARNGAPDVTGADNGRRKLDVFVHRKSSPELTGDFVSAMRAQPCHFAFVHFTETDSAGHTAGWGSDAYNAALVTIDGCLGRIMDLIATDAALKGRTALIVTADHGGKDRGHSDATLPLDYTVPFFVWGTGIAPGDLYAWNKGTRQSPGTGRPEYGAQPQPIRNGDVGNLALSLLGLAPIPGSHIGAGQDLRPAPPAAQAP